MVDDEILERLYKARDILNTGYQALPKIRQLSGMVLRNELKQVFITTIPD